MTLHGVRNRSFNQGMRSLSYFSTVLIAEDVDNDGMVIHGILKTVGTKRADNLKNNESSSTVFVMQTKK